MCSAQPNKRKFGQSFQYDQANQQEYFSKHAPDKKARTASPQGGQAFHTLFEQAANRLGVSTEIKAIRICHAARQSIANLLPSHQQDIEVISFQHGTLNLRAASSSVSQRLHTKRHLLQQSLNQTFGDTTIKKINIRS